MIGVTLIMRAFPAKGDELAALWQKIASDVRASEPGCLQVSVIRSESDPDELVIFERYATQADLDAHHSSDYSKVTRPLLEPLRMTPVRRVAGPVIV